MAKAVTDEEIIKALLDSSTMQQAADLAGISVRALYDRTKEPAFIALYSRVRTDLLRSTLAELKQHTKQATATVVEIMSNQEEKASTRLQAAQMILDSVARYTKLLQAAEDTATAEYAHQKANYNPFDMFDI